MASAAIHGLLFVIWLDLAGSGPNGVPQKETVLEVVSIETIPEKPSVAMPPKPLIAESLVAQMPEQVAVKAPAVIQVQQAKSASHLSANPMLETENTGAHPPEPEAQFAMSEASPPASNEQREQINTLVRNHLESFKFYPASARRRGIEGHVDVAFILTHNGAADKITVLQGSGYAMLDQAAIQTVAKAQPFPVDDGSYRFRLRFKRL